MKKRIVIFIVILVLVAGGIAAVINKRNTLAQMAKPVSKPPVVVTALASDGGIDVTNRQLGEIQPYLQADLAPRITGSILSISKREGDSVAKGEIVAVIDDRELGEKAKSSHAEVLATKQRLAGARSVYETQRSVTERDEKLYRAGAISKEALERSQAAMDSAKSVMDSYIENIHGLEGNVETARLQVGYTRITAPFSGIVTKRWVEPGDLAVPGKPILTIQQTSPVKVVVRIPQELMGQVKPGTTLVLSNGSLAIETSVSKVYPALGANFLGSIETILPKSPFGLPAGSTVGVDIVTSAVSGVIIPENALVRTDKGTFVYMIDGGTVHIRRVEALGVSKGKAVVKGAIAAGDKVAVAQENKLLSLSEGMTVTVGGNQ
jgi:RND family efflux transporter MFP subunit